MARLVQTIPIRISNSLEPEVEIHQYPLLSRALRVPPSAAESGKRIRARSKPQAGIFEVHIPADIRPDVWNHERAKEHGAARAEEDVEERNAASSSSSKGKMVDETPTQRRLAEVRLRSEPMPDRAVYMLATARDGEIHLHPISRTMQFRPTMTYLDIISRKARPKRSGADSDSDDGPPPDPDEPSAPPPQKNKKKADVDAREVQLSAKKANDDKLHAGLNNLSQVRQEMLGQLRAEMTEKWQDWEYCDVDSKDSKGAVEKLAALSTERLQSESATSEFYKDLRHEVPPS
ncbi:hypothetical protein BKA62DRAFT_684926 [Auriculariales sp. MPI-PUGE-AT-0066]|nr:hypothetical protein BKA62DRAFT_684926 [Auriculariales sp. MPI-PUGE-AT-0066]